MSTIPEFLEFGFFLNVNGKVKKKEMGGNKGMTHSFNKLYKASRSLGRMLGTGAMEISMIKSHL